MTEPAATNLANVEDIATYLEQSPTWTRSNNSPADDGLVNYIHELTNRETYTVVLPSTQPRTPEMLTQALQTIAFVEQRPIEELVDDVVSGGSDVLAVRLSVGGQPGHVELSTLISSAEALRQLLVGGTWSIASDGRLMPPTRRSAAADRWVEAARVSTEPGSFILNAWLPLTGAPSSDSSIPEGQLPLIAVRPDPFGRRITRQLSNDVRHAAAAATAIESGRADLSALTNPARSKVNVNVLSGLANLGGNDHSPYRIRFGWSPRLGLIEPELHEFTSNTQQVLHRAVEEIRSTIPRHTRLRGLVVQLRRVGHFGAGTIVLLGFASADGSAAEARRVELQLSEADYAVAINAHENGIEVTALGELSRSGNRFYLREITGFAQVPGLPDDIS